MSKTPRNKNSSTYLVASATLPFDVQPEARELAGSKMLALFEANQRGPQSTGMCLQEFLLTEGVHLKNLGTTWEQMVPNTVKNRDA